MTYFLSLTADRALSSTAYVLGVARASAVRSRRGTSLERCDTSVVTDRFGFLIRFSFCVLSSLFISCLFQWTRLRWRPLH